jgi:hypothetical protein
LSKQKSPKTPDDLFTIGLDAEWVLRDGRNFVLSFQWCVLVGGKKRLGIRFPDGVRPTLATVLQTILSDAKEAGLFHQYPESVFVVAHYSPAELHLLADFPTLKREVDLVRKSFITLTKPVPCRITDTNRNQRTINVHFRDTMLLTPGGSSLDVLGEIHGIPKIPLPPGRIERMDLLLDEDQDLFEKYALRDAEISATHARWMADKNRFLTGKAEIPHTLGGMAQRFCLNLWESQNIDENTVLGQEKRYKRSRNGRRAHVRTIDSVSKYEYLAENAFHGGRNEALWFGPTPETDLIDVDLVSAYPTAMSTIGMPQWEQSEPVSELDQFRPDDLGFAKVKFRFHDSTPFPCLPVRTEFDLLLFPREGETYATAIELRCAAEQGATIEILDGVRVPCDPGTRPFEVAAMKGQVIRRALEKIGKHGEATLYKELVNSLYGKTAQGIQKRTAFDSRTGASKPLPPSKLTQPFLAAHTTGLIRAAVSAAIARIGQAGFRVYSVTTDGILTDAPEDIVRDAFVNPITTGLREARQRLSPSESIVEIKHRVRQCVVVSPRGAFTSVPGPSGQIILARAGVKTPNNLRSREEANAWLLHRFFNRKPGETFEFETLRPVRQIYHQDTDLVSVLEEKELNLDYDMKRRPLDPHEGQIFGQGAHLAFSTSPWKNVDEFMTARMRTQKWRTQGNALKTIDDFDSWEDYQASADLTKHGIRGSASGGCWDAALRQFLRAFVRGEWGLHEHRNKLSNKETVAALQKLGMDVHEQDLKNAARQAAKLIPRAIPPTRRVLQLVNALKISFPDFQEEHMLRVYSADGDDIMANP